MTPQLPSLNQCARDLFATNPHLTDTASLREAVTSQYPHRFIHASRAVLNEACRRAIKGNGAIAQEPQAATGKPTGPEPATTKAEGGGIVIAFPASQSIRTLADLLSETDVDLNEWEVTSHIVNKWDTHAVINKQPVCLPNFQVKAWLKPVERVTEYTVAEMAKVLAPLVKRTGASFRPKMPANSGDYMLEFDIFDLHMGKIADVLESGQEYNLEIAAALFEAAIEALLTRAAGFPIGEVLLPVGNDFYNSDTKIGSTTAGTPQHEAARWQRTFVRGASLIIATVNRLRERGLKVRLVTVPGNHDECNVFFLGQVLGATFADCPDVSIDNSFGTRKYVQFHDCAIMFTHGNAEKEANLAQIFAQEQPQLWAATRFRETHLAHVHHKKEFKYRTMGEQIGMTTRYMRSLSAVDAWHHWKGYIGSQRSAEGFVWAKGEGVVAHLTYTYTNQQLNLAA